MLARSKEPTAAALRRRAYTKAGEIALPEQVITRAERQWIYSDHDLDRTPSILDGMPVAQERELRFKGVFFITQAGRGLKLPVKVIAIATILFQRYLMRQSLVNTKKSGRRVLHHYDISAIALYVAAKVEETSPRLRDFIIQICRVGEKKPNLIVDEQDKVYWRWRDTILLNENLFLETICFDLNIESPQSYLNEMLKKYKIKTDADEKTTNVLNASWAFLADASTSQACLLYTPQAIAVSALYIASLRFGLSFPDNEKGRAWWTTHGASYDEVQRTCEYMAGLYESKKSKGNEFKLYAARPAIPNERLDKTRDRREEDGSSAVSPEHLRGWDDPDGTGSPRSSFEASEAGSEGRPARQPSHPRHQNGDGGGSVSGQKRVRSRDRFELAESYSSDARPRHGDSARHGSASERDEAGPVTRVPKRPRKEGPDGSSILSVDGAGAGQEGDGGSEDGECSEEGEVEE